MRIDSLGDSLKPVAKPFGHAIFEQHPQLTDKLAVDLLNGLAATADHAKEQRNREGPLSRFIDEVTGADRRRRNLIDTSLTEHVQTCVAWLKDLQLGNARSMLAIGQVATQTAELASCMGLMLEDVEALDADLRRLRNDAETRFDAMQADLARIDIEQRAIRHLKSEEDRWDAGHTERHSPIVRAFLLMDGLFWGPFGDCMRHPSKSANALEWLDLVRNPVKARLRSELEWDIARPLPISAWRETCEQIDAIEGEAIRYLAEPANAWQPLSLAISADEDTRLPLRVPRVMSIDRAIDRLSEEIFVRRTFA